MIEFAMKPDQICLTLSDLSDLTDLPQFSSPTHVSGLR